MLFRQALDKYQAHLVSLDRSPATLRGYAAELLAFVSFLETSHNGPVYLTDVMLADLEDHLAHLKARGLKPASRARTVNILRSFFDYALKHDHIDHNPAAKLEPVKVPHRERTYLTEEEVEELAAAMHSDVHRALLRTLFMTGLRISEAVKLTLSDVDLLNQVIRVRGGKGNKDRTVPIPERLLGVLEDYLVETRPGVLSSLFFATRKSGKITCSGMNQVLRKAATDLGWSTRVSCHILRHSFASHLVHRNVNIVNLQKLLGHASLSTTAIYTHTNMRELADAVKVF